MADVFGVSSGASLSQLMAQKARAGLPFNPLSNLDITGLNVSRLQQVMDSYAWDDPRFVTADQAAAQGWSIAADAVPVKIFVLGEPDMVAFFNARFVIGMPGLYAMLAMSDAQLSSLQGSDSAGPEQESLVISPGLAHSMPLEGGARSAVIGGPRAVERKGERGASTQAEAAVTLQADDAGQAQPTRYAVLAPYWNANGLHNAEGLAAAALLNRAILQRKLSEDREAIARLMSLNEKARLLGLSIVPETQYLNDPNLQRDPARPITLLDGALVRDKDGSYRPKAGGPTVVQDQGDSLVLRNKTEQAFRGAMELAVAKGWTAIELKGKPAALSEAWIEAKLMGLDVINYQPNEKDMEKFEARLALEAQRKAAQSVPASDQTPELVVQQAFVNKHGMTEFAKCSYTVSYQGGTHHRFDDAKAAAHAFAQLPASVLPVVMRSVVRAEGEVLEGVVAGVAPARAQGGAAQVLESVLDREFDEAMDAILAERDLLASSAMVAPSINKGPHSGLILKAEAGRIAQDAGQGRIVWHDVANLRGVIPIVGQNADISYYNGVGQVVAKKIESGLER